MEYALEDITFDEYCTPKVLRNSCTQVLAESNPITDLEKQLSKFNEDQQAEEAKTHSFLAKVNARITSHFSEDGLFMHSTASNSDFNRCVESDCDGRFILQKNSNYYFPEFSGEG